MNAMTPDPSDEPTRPVAILVARPADRDDDALDLALDLDDDETDPAITPWRLTSLRELTDFLDEETLPD